VASGEVMNRIDRVVSLSFLPSTFQPCTILSQMLLFWTLMSRTLLPWILVSSTSCYLSRSVLL